MPNPPSYRFDGKNEAAQKAAEDQAAALIKNISAETEAGVRALIVRSIADGIPVYDAARLIEGMVGLDERRAGALMNYREGLINEGLDFGKVNTLTDRYSEKLLRQRGETIARTEVMGALNAGALESAAQAQAAGLLSKEAVKEWIATADCCDDCDDLDGEQVPLDEDFPDDGGDGPPLHPNCRCSVAVTDAGEV